MSDRVPVREAHMTVPDSKVLTWRDAFIVFAGAVLEGSKALHRIADALEVDGARERCPRCGGVVVNPARHGEGWCIDVNGSREP